MLDQIQGFHIEPTNMCTLKCPQCARTDFIERFPSAWSNRNLNLDTLKSFLDINLSGKIINLCGNYGDPIYYPNLIKMITYFKNQGAIINLSTNGSYKSISWWKSVADLLDENDTIVFGIDGIPSTFTTYRINADWASIEDALLVLSKTSIKIVWQYIIFSFNENDIDAARELANTYNVTEFKIVNSDRWTESTEWLKPTQTGIKSHHAIKWKTDPVKDTEIDPLCKISNNQHFISADGFYTPCCYLSDHRFYFKSEFYKNKDMYDISKTTISKILDSKLSNNFYSSLETAKLNCCMYSCPKL